MNAVDILKFGQQTVLHTIDSFFAIQTFGQTLKPKVQNLLLLASSNRA
jgi:hypothetical protein